MFSSVPLHHIVFFFFFNDPATTEIYTLSLHDALPIFTVDALVPQSIDRDRSDRACAVCRIREHHRSEEHTSELQSRFDLVCRLLLEKKKIARSRRSVVSPYRPGSSSFLARTLRRASRP